MGMLSVLLMVFSSVILMFVLVGLELLRWWFILISAFCMLCVLWPIRCGVSMLLTLLHCSVLVCELFIEILLMFLMLFLVRMCMMLKFDTVSGSGPFVECIALVCGVCIGIVWIVWILMFILGRRFFSFCG